MSASRHQHLIGRSVGDGHCVALVQEVAGLPHTSLWRRGVRARGGDLPGGTPIATFDAAGRYTNRTDGTSHAAILLAENSDGLLVVDQWLGQPTHTRVIRFRAGRGDPVNDGDAYFTIEIADA